MIFSSDLFIFAFLPAALLGLVVARRLFGAHLYWIVIASLFFYGYWKPVYLPLIVGSILINFALGRAIERNRSKPLMVVGVTINLLALGWFKYANFLAENVEWATGAEIGLPEIVLPLAISFFTFQQISYLVDAYRGETHPHSFIQYAAFVSFFPQLIAGPILQQKRTMQEFAGPKAFHVTAEGLGFGLMIFIAGMAKKLLIADPMGTIATPLFDHALENPLSLEQAWTAALAYSFQLYFDFSGYSDMAIGLAMMVSIRLPVNFNSPYRAVNIADFWRRWHMTLSGFLRDYLYIPLGGNRHGPSRTYVNLFIVMVLGGLWHGAGWTFIIWGALHGGYLLLHRFFAHRIKPHLPGAEALAPVWTVISWALTMVLVVIAWVVFRADTLDAAINVWTGMAGMGGEAGEIARDAFLTGWRWQAFAALTVLCLILPNLPQIAGYVDAGGIWRQTVAALYQPHIIGLIAAIVIFASCFAMLRANSAVVSEFLYWDF
ncbi:MAG: MBOAT family O-acyltransferase [Minwuia sp.]|uniref:MBOAT family O-acyltransferase n=1 Tax=Minwuia sp. TaxID=2493630 RepID=UPI003A8568D2